MKLYVCVVCRMKYWSCCQKKTTEFDKFMDQVGCEIGRHRWTAPSVSKTYPAYIHS